MMTELIEIKGTVVDSTSPWKPNKHIKNFAVTYATVECPIGKDNNGNDRFAYYTFRTQSTEQGRGLFNGAEIKCTIKRVSKIWEQNGHWKMKDAKEWNGEERIPVGKIPIIFENYELVGKVESTLPFNKPMYMDDSLDGGPLEDDGLPF